MVLIPSPVCEQDQPEQLQGCGESGSDVGQGGSTENPSGSCVFISIKDIGILQNVQCSPGSIKLHRQRHQLKNKNGRKEDHTNVSELHITQDQTDQDQRHGDAGGKVDNRHDGAADRQGGISSGVLDRMAAFMGCYTDGRNRRRTVDRIRQPQDFRPGIIVIGQVSGYALDGYILDPGAAQDHFSGLFGTDLSLAEYLAVFAEASVDISRSCDADQYSHYDKDVSRIKIRIIKWHDKSLLSIIGYTGLFHNTQTYHGIY